MTPSYWVMRPDPTKHEFLRCHDVPGGKVVADISESTAFSSRDAWAALMEGNPGFCMDRLVPNVDKPLACIHQQHPMAC